MDSDESKVILDGLSHIPEKDMWDLDLTIAKFILPRLQKFRHMDRESGAPMEFYEIVDDKIVDEAAGNVKWAAALDEMIFAFDYSMNSESYNPFPERLVDNLFVSKNGAVSFREKQGVDIATDPAYIAYVDRGNELDARKIAGMQLFAKHFDGLWI
jgi:hypothetical protein